MDAQCYEEFGHGLGAVVIKEKRGDAVRYDLLIEEDICIVQGCCLRGRDRSCKF